MAVMHEILFWIQRTVTLLGVLIIFSGILMALGQYLYSFFVTNVLVDNSIINVIRLKLTRILILGLEFIVAGDLIGTTTAPDYYSLGMLAIIVVIRSLLSYSLNREMLSISSDSAEGHLV